MVVTTGPFPVYNNMFKIGTKGRTGSESDMKPVEELESLEITIDGSVEDWNPFTTNGWSKSMMTGKSLTVSGKGKRCVGDSGNDYIANTAFKDGLDCETKASIDFPDGSILAFDCVIDLKSINGGDSTAVAPLEFDLKCIGQPTYTPASSGA